MILQTAIIGSGVIAPEHIRGYQQCPDVRVKWACDLQLDKAAAIAGQFAIPYTTSDYHEILRDPEVDCISVCTDHASHAAIACDALDQGKHVLCEKALSASKDGLDRLVGAHARNPHLVLSPVLQHRFEPVHRKVRELLASNTLGQLLTASMRLICSRTDEYYRGAPWRGTWAFEGGSVFINQAIHYIDLLAWICGEVKTVSGSWANLTHKKSIETEDTAVAILEFTSGALGILEATSSSHVEWENTLTFHGTEATIVISDARAARVAHREPSIAQALRAELDHCAESIVSTGQSKAYYGPGHQLQIADFIDSIRTHRPPYVDIASARQTVDSILAVYQSYASGTRITLAPRLKT